MAGRNSSCSCGSKGMLSLGEVGAATGGVLVGLLVSNGAAMLGQKLVDSVGGETSSKTYKVLNVANRPVAGLSVAGSSVIAATKLRSGGAFFAGSAAAGGAFALYNVFRAMPIELAQMAADQLTLAGGPPLTPEEMNELYEAQHLPMLEEHEERELYQSVDDPETFVMAGEPALPLSGDIFEYARDPLA